MRNCKQTIEGVKYIDDLKRACLLHNSGHNCVCIPFLSLSVCCTHPWHPVDTDKLHHKIRKVAESLGAKLLWLFQRFLIAFSSIRKRPCLKTPPLNPKAFLVHRELLVESLIHFHECFTRVMSFCSPGTGGCLPAGHQVLGPRLTGSY